MKGIVRALRQPYLDTAFETGEAAFTRLIERPGRWMSERDLSDLRRDLRAVAAKTINAGGLDYGVLSNHRQRMNDSIVTVVYRTGDNQPIAFNALAIMDVIRNGQPTEVLHLGLVMVDPDERSRGLSWILYGLTCLILFLRSGLRPLYISSVTQVPAVVGMVAETFTDVYPVPGADIPKDFAKVQLARAIMANNRHVFGVGDEADFDESRFIIRNAYTGGSDNLRKTFEEAPKHRKETYNDFCRESLDYGRGDDFLQIGTIDLNAARRYVTRSVPRRSLASVLVLGILVVMRRIVLPILYWMNDSRQYGDLRPWKT